MAKCLPPSANRREPGSGSRGPGTGSAVHPLARAGRFWLWMKHARRFEAATRAVAFTQEQRLFSLLKANCDTVYGRQHGFDRIRTVQDYQARVPIAEYEHFEPYMERAMRGERGVLTRETPLTFALTSGTTGLPKFIPVTPAYLADYNHAVQVHTSRLVEDYPEIVLGTALLTSSCDVEGYTEGGIPYGAISGFLARRQPRIVKRWFALPDGIGRIKDLEAKYYVTLLLTLRQDLRVAISVSPSSLVLLAEKMDVHAQRLVRDLHDGTVCGDILLPKAAREIARELVRPAPERARCLGRLLEREGTLYPRDAWPNLQVLSCWKGGTMPLYLERLRRRWGDVPVRDVGFMASEGRGSIPMGDDGAAGALALTSHFFEFVPKEDIDRPRPTCLLAGQLEPNQEYFILFTTSSGLYRYHINDVVRVTGFYHGAPLIEFVRKGRGVSSITGEKLTEPQVTATLLTVIASTGLDVKHFSAAPRWSDPPHYALMAEVGGAGSPDELRRFVLEFDRVLSQMNVEYRSKRQSGRLGATVLQILEPGTFDRYRQARVLAGAPEAQVKVPHLSPDLEWGRQFSVREEVRVELSHTVR